MTKQQQIIINIFRYFWRLAALLLIVYIAAQSLKVTPVWRQSADWSRTLSPDITGWYPESRASWQGGYLVVKGEPLYLQLYRSGDYKQLAISGSLATSSVSVKLGLRQSDGSWWWQDILGRQFSLSYDLSNAQFKRNKLEMILSAPDLSASSTLALANDWQFIWGY
ncbi:MAG: hypothetical protein C3F02_04915 [Parcubacteria group bacterium]|nr:MAG: hypothetical protein C3F02_04915 [Parcubacteria group bacterium]